MYLDKTWVHLVVFTPNCAWGEGGNQILQHVEEWDQWYAVRRDVATDMTKRLTGKPVAKGKAQPKQSGSSCSA